MEERLSEILDNILGLLLLEGSYEIEETDDGFLVSIETKDAGRLIGARGESLEGLQLVINQIMSRDEVQGKLRESNGFKRVVLDVSGWRKQKEEDLKSKAQEFGKQVLETRQELELEPQSPWQRRVIHMTIGEMEGLATESIGEGRDRHIVIKLKSQKPAPSEPVLSEVEVVEGSKVPPKARFARPARRESKRAKGDKSEES